MDWNIKKTDAIREIDNQIKELRNKRYELEKQDIMDFKEKAQANVGRCFLINGRTYAKVVGIPQETYTVTGISFNRYQYQALYLGYEVSAIDRFSMHKVKPILPFYEDTLHSNAWETGTDILETKYEEITPEEFNAEFEKRLQEFRERVKI